MRLNTLLFAASIFSAATTCFAQEWIVPLRPVELVQGGFEFTEGPASGPDGTLYFSDIPATRIHKLAIDGTISLFTDQSRHTNGMIFTAAGKLLGCQMDGTVVQYDLESGRPSQVLADSFEGIRFNAPNDLIADKFGGVYFTDPLYRAPEPLPQSVQTVYYIAADASVTRVTEPISAPNGIGLSPDGKTLYVVPSTQPQMLAYDVLQAGKLGPQRVHCVVRQPADQTSTGGDGMVVDVEGNLYITTHIGVQIFSPAGAAVGLVELAEQPANVTFGGSDRKTIYMTARTGLYKAPMPIAGLAPN